MKIINDQYTVIAGEHDLYKPEIGEEKRGIAEIRCLRADFAIIKLKQPIRLSATINPVDLPDSNRPIPEGTNCSFSGWGKAGWDKNASKEAYQNEI